MVYVEPEDEVSIVKEEKCVLTYLKEGPFGKKIELKIEGSKEAVLGFAAEHIPVGEAK